MHKVSYTLLALAIWPSFCIGQLPNAQRGQLIYDICGACHGPQAQGDQSLSAPPLAGQRSRYLMRQLMNFRSGLRGGDSDVQAQEMQQILTTVSNESDWQSAIEFVLTLPMPQPHDETGGGDAKRGQRIYQTCASCHGSAGEGNDALEAPSLVQLPAWYIVEQLRKFRTGLRGTARNDEPGNRMRTIALTTLRSDGDISTVASYIAKVLSLNGK
jgi:cytochrome c oxidase subunit 2